MSYMPTIIFVIEALLVTAPVLFTIIFFIYWKIKYANYGVNIIYFSQHILNLQYILKKINGYFYAFTRWNLINSFIYIIYVVYLLLFSNILHTEFIEGKGVSIYSWNTTQFYVHCLCIILNKIYSSLEWCLNSPPKPHSFATLPVQSSLYMHTHKKNKKISVKNTPIVHKSFLNKNRKVIVVKKSFYVKLKTKLTDTKVILSIISTVILGIISRYLILNYFDIDVLKDVLSVVSISYFSSLAVLRQIIQTFIDHMQDKVLTLSMNTSNPQGIGQASNNPQGEGQPGSNSQERGQADNNPQEGGQPTNYSNVNYDSLISELLEKKRKVLKELVETNNACSDKSITSSERSELLDKKSGIYKELREFNERLIELRDEENKTSLEKINIGNEVTNKQLELNKSHSQILDIISQLESIQEKKNVKAIFDPSEHLYVDIPRNIGDREGKVITNLLEHLVGRYESELEDYNSNIEKMTELEKKLKTLHSSNEATDKLNISSYNSSIVLHNKYLDEFKAAFEKTITREK